MKFVRFLTFSNFRSLKKKKFKKSNVTNSTSVALGYCKKRTRFEEFSFSESKLITLVALDFKRNFYIFGTLCVICFSVTHSWILSLTSSAHSLRNDEKILKCTLREKEREKETDTMRNHLFVYPYTHTLYEGVIKILISLPHNTYPRIIRYILMLNSLNAAIKMLIFLYFKLNNYMNHARLLAF